MSYSKITFLLSFSLFQSLDQLRSLCQVYTKPRGLKSHSNSGNVMKLFNYKCTWVHYILFTVYYHKDKDTHTYNISSLKAKVKQQCTSRAEILLLWTQLTHKRTPLFCSDVQCISQTQRLKKIRVFFMCLWYWHELLYLIENMYLCAKGNISSYLVRLRLTNWYNAFYVFARL